MEDFNTKETSTNQELKCKNCASVLKFKPGTNALVCEHCGTENIIEASWEALVDAVEYILKIQGRLCIPSALVELLRRVYHLSH